MSHTSEKRWATIRVGNTGFTSQGVSDRAQELLSAMITSLLEVEEAYQQMQEIYIYVGGNATDLAKLLFKEDIEGRIEPGTDAVLTIDIVSPGIIDAVSIQNAGTGYTNGFNFTQDIITNNGNGGRIEYDVIDGSITNASVVVPGTGYTIGTGVTINEFPGSNAGIPSTTPTTEEITKAADLVAAMVAAHELYEAANNIAVTQSDRLTAIRRMI